MSNWQPIETLRKQNEPVLMRLPDGSVTVGEAACLRPYPEYRDLLDITDPDAIWHGYGYDKIEPTHWQPFPSGDLNGKSHD